MSNLNELIDSAFAILTEFLIPIALGLCFLYFLWGIFKYVNTSAGSDKAEGRGIMVWGVIGIFVAFSIWGIIEFIRGELGVNYIRSAERSGVPSVDSTINFNIDSEEPPTFSR